MEQAVAIVTGAASGIGRGIAGYLAERGVSVVLADVQDDGADAAKQITEQGAHAWYAHAGVTKKAEVEALFNDAGDVSQAAQAASELAELIG